MPIKKRKKTTMLPKKTEKPIVVDPYPFKLLVSVSPSGDAQFEVTWLAKDKYPPYETSTVMSSVLHSITSGAWNEQIAQAVDCLGVNNDEKVTSDSVLEKWLYKVNNQIDEKVVVSPTEVFSIRHGRKRKDK